MSTSDSTIYGVFRSHLLGVFLFVLLTAVTCLAQGTGDSVFIINQTTTNNAAGVVSDYLAGEIGEGLQNQFPCVDYSSPEDVKAVLDAMRDKQLLTGELSQEQLAAIAGAIGARYVVVANVTVLPNGQTTVTARLLDTKTSTAIASYSETAANAEAAFETVESVAKKLLQSFSTIFKNRCEPHWTGSISFSRLVQTSKTETLRTSTDTTTKTLSATANIVLQPMTLGFSGRFSSQARATQNYRDLEVFSSSQTAEIPCREPGRNTYYKKVTGDFTRTRIENGDGADVVTVFIRFFDDGRYSIYATGVKPIKTKVTVETKSNPVDCRPVPTSISKQNEDSKNFVLINLEGRVDPKNPNLLTGKKVEGEPGTGQQTWTWTLRLVEPGKKKQTPRNSKQIR